MSGRFPGRASHTASSRVPAGRLGSSVTPPAARLSRRSVGPVSAALAAPSMNIRRVAMHSLPPRCQATASLSEPSSVSLPLVQQVPQRVLDQAKLEGVADDSYGVPEAEYARLIGLPLSSRPRPTHFLCGNHEPTP